MIVKHQKRTMGSEMPRTTRDSTERDTEDGRAARSPRRSGGRAVEELRSRHSHFVYQRYAISHAGERLTFRSQFTTTPDLVFTPEVTIDGVSQEVLRDCPPGVLENMAFHLGLMEIPSYWKATCAPNIVVKAAPMNGPQLEWLKDLLLQGMGEFFFVNDIDFTGPEFITLRSESATGQLPRDERARSSHRVLVPLSGGKDSIVTWETLSRHGLELGTMALNPTQAAEQILVLSGCSQPIRVRRVIDSNLLQLNARGYLNGHTPFSSYLAFLAVTCASLFGFGRVAMSNERSSDEGNVVYRGRSVNHQYSKSLDFERKFQWYAAHYLASGFEFFSFLRPLFEIQITRVFAKATRYHAAFRSCNRGQARNAWCGSCPKCLAVYSMLFPFLDTVEVWRIFSQDLFSRPELASIALDLLTPGNKPFECVGTHEENLVSFYLSVRKLQAQGIPLPPLLRRVHDQVLAREADLEQRAVTLLGAWSLEHAVPQDLLPLLEAETSDNGQA